MPYTSCSGETIGYHWPKRQHPVLGAGARREGVGRARQLEGERDAHRRRLTRRQSVERDAQVDRGRPLGLHLRAVDLTGPSATEIAERPRHEGEVDVAHRHRGTVGQGDLGDGVQPRAAGIEGGGDLVALIDATGVAAATVAGSASTPMATITRTARARRAGIGPCCRSRGGLSSSPLTVQRFSRSTCVVARRPPPRRLRHRLCRGACQRARHGRPIRAPHRPDRELHRPATGPVHHSYGGRHSRPSPTAAPTPPPSAAPTPSPTPIAREPVDLARRR